MTQREREVLRDALQLPTRGRARVAAKLIESIDGEPDADVEAAWAAEIERRARRVLAGESKGEDADVVLARVRRKLRRR